jgi:hypothetical protein
LCRDSAAPSDAQPFYKAEWRVVAGLSGSVPN